MVTAAVAVPDVSTPQVQLVSDLAANNGGELNPDTIHPGHDRFVVANLTFSPELQGEGGETSDPDTIGSDLDAAVVAACSSRVYSNSSLSQSWICFCTCWY